MIVLAMYVQKMKQNNSKSRKMFFQNQNQNQNQNQKKKETTVKLEGCLDESKDVVVCKHGFGGTCWHCIKNTEPIEEEKTDPFTSNTFKNA